MENLILPIVWLWLDLSEKHVVLNRKSTEGYIFTVWESKINHNKQTKKIPAFAIRSTFYNHFKVCLEVILGVSVHFYCFFILGISPHVRPRWIKTDNRLRVTDGFSIRPVICEDSGLCDVCGADKKSLS